MQKNLVHCHKCNRTKDGNQSLFMFPEDNDHQEKWTNKVIEAERTWQPAKKLLFADHFKYVKLSLKSLGNDDSY